MELLARRNLFHDKFRFAVTLTGIVFALVLIIIQFGLFLGFTTTTSNNIDHSAADLWIVFHGVGYFDTGRNFSERKFYQVLSTPGVAAAEKYMQAFGRWKRPDGRVEHMDTKNLETLVELDAGERLPLGLRVDAFAEAGASKR